MTSFSVCEKGRYGLSASPCIGCRNRWIPLFGRFFLYVVLLFIPFLCSNTLAQGDSFKEGASLCNIGVGYEWMSDAYSSNGFALDVRVRFYASERLFCELMGHWGTHEGGKYVMQQGTPFHIRDERNTLLGAIGPGYELFRLENQKFDIYVKGLIGYGGRSSCYDDYIPSGSEDGTVTLRCEKTKKGIVAVAGLGADLRFKNWLLTPSVDVFYIGKEWNVSTMISFGFFFL